MWLTLGKCAKSKIHVCYCDGILRGEGWVKVWKKAKNVKIRGFAPTFTRLGGFGGVFKLRACALIRGLIFKIFDH